MKKTILIAVLILFRTITWGQDDRSTLGYIPMSNIYGSENKVNGAFFNYKQFEQSYISIKLTGFDIGVEQDKIGWKEYDPFLYIKIEFGDKELIKVLRPEDIKKTDVGTSSRARSINNLHLLGPFPYEGEEVRVTVQLYAFKVKDNLGNAIGILDNMSSLFPTQIQEFVKISKVVGNSLNQLIPNSKRLVSLDKTWNPKEDFSNFEYPSTLKEGFFIIHPSATDVDYNLIHINDVSEIKYRNADKTESFLYSKNINFVVVEFQHFITRPDIQSLPLYKIYRQSLYSAVRGDASTMDAKFEEVLNTLYSSEMFTDYDKMYNHNYLYNNLVVQVKNYDANYRETPTPLLQNAQVKGFKEKLSLMKLRQLLVEMGKIQPGESLNKRQLKKVIKSLTSDQQDYIYQRIDPELKTDLEIDEDSNKKVEEFYEETIKE
mgnify:CR=1 FL=1